MAKESVYCVRCGKLFVVWGALVKTGFSGPVCKPCYPKEMGMLRDRRRLLGKKRFRCTRCQGLGHRKETCRSEEAVKVRVVNQQRAIRMQKGRDFCWKYGNLKTKDPFLRALRRGEI